MEDPNDRNKISVVNIANTVQRTCFKEVRLQPKGIEPLPSAKWKVKGKGQDAEDGDVADPALQPKEVSHILNRVTGKNSPRAGSQHEEIREARSHKAEGEAKGVEEIAAEESGEVENDMVS